MSKVKPHKRVNDILLGPLERPALQWLAAHMPPWVTPDVLTITGIIGAVMIFAGYALSNVHPAFLWLSFVGFIVNWFGDSLDGTLARYRKIERPKFGFFVDHTVDAFSELLVVLGLGVTPYVRFEIASMALVGYLLMSVLVYIRTYVDGVFKISYGKLGPTEVRVILMILGTVMFFAGRIDLTFSFGVFTIYDLVIAVVAFVLIAIFCVSSMRQTLELAKLGE